MERERERKEDIFTMKSCDWTQQMYVDSLNSHCSREKDRERERKEDIFIMKYLKREREGERKLRKGEIFSQWRTVIEYTNLCRWGKFSLCPHEGPWLEPWTKHGRSRPSKQTVKFFCAPYLFCLPELYLWIVCGNSVFCGGLCSCKDLDAPYTSFHHIRPIVWASTWPRLSIHGL